MPVASGHKRTNSTAPSPSVREMHNLILGSGKTETSPTRGGTPTPRELFGSNTSFPLKDREILQPREYSSLSFRKSLEFEKASSILPPIRNVKTPDISTPPPPAHNALIRSSTDFDDTPSKVTVHDIHTISSQLTSITTIATNLQREMTNLSRRSKDNATDLMALKEAARNRDEEIRRSLRDLQTGLTSFEATDRLLEGRHSHLSIVAPSTSSGSDRGSNYEDDNPKFAAASTQVLERVLREMPTKDDQDRALGILQDIQGSLKAHQSQYDRGVAEQKILSVLEEIRDREESRGKEVALLGPRTEDDNERVLSMLEELREDLRQDKIGEERIMTILEEIREKEAEVRSDERILSAIDELKEKEGDERLDRVISMLEELRDRDPDEKVVSMLEEVRVKLEVMSEDLVKQSETSIPHPTSPSEMTPALLPAAVHDEIIALLKTVQEGVCTGGGLSKDIKRLVEDWREIWTGHDKTVGDALKDLGGQIEVLSAVQRAAMARMPSYSSLGLPSQALTTTNPPLPPDLDNEAAITALANIASTTTRTDITLSSINALIKVFQKESYHSNTNSTEALATLGRFLEEIGQAIGTTNSQTGDIRKVLEVIRTGVCSGNDRLAEFESNTSRQIDDLTHLQNNLQRSIMGDDEEALWKVDLGVKDDVEELSRKIDELCDKNVEALKSSTAKTVEAINNSNPTELIEELKTALGAMAQRSLDAFKKSEEAVQQLKEETVTSAEKNIEAIQNVNQAVAIADFRTEVKEMAEKSYAICEAIDAKCGFDEVKDILSGMKQELAGLIGQSLSTATTESTDVKSAIDKLREELDAKMEDSLTTAVALASADEKTSAALAELKSEVSDTLSKAVTLADKDDSEKILEPIRELRQEVLDMIEKSNTALAAPVHYPEADEIKSRIEMLSRELFEAMEKTADLVAETGLSNGAAGQQVKSTVEALRKDIGAMGSSIAAAVASNSATAVEEGIKGAFEDMKQTVMVKVEQGLVTSDKAVSCIADLSQQTRDSINELKKEVIEMMNKSISMAVATVKPDESEDKNKSLLDALETKITDVVISSMAASTNSDDIKELIESLKADIDGFGKQIAVPTTGPDDTIKKLLGELKEDVAGMISASSSSQDTKGSVDELRKEVQEMMEKTSSMVAPMSVSALIPTTTSSATVEKIEEAIASLKEDVNELVEKSLAAAIANSTFDSEENVKEAIEELKRDVKDTLEKSMVPLPQQANNESSRMVREAMEALRQELATMFEKREVGEAEDREEMVTRLDALKGQFGELLEKSTNVEVKEAVDVLKIQVHGLLERSSGAEYADLKEMIRALNGQIVVREPMPADDEVNVILEALRSQVEELAGKLADGDIKSILDTLKNQVGELSNRPPPTTDNSELKNILESLRSQISGLESQPSEDTSGFKEAVEGFKSLLGDLAGKSDAEQLKVAIDSFKSELTEIVEKSTSNLSTVDDVFAVKILIETFKDEFSTVMDQHTETIKELSPADALGALKNDLKELLERSVAIPAYLEQPAKIDETQVKEVKDAIEELRKEVKEMITKSGNMIVTAPSQAPPILAATPDSLDIKEAVADISSAVGECRVEVAVVKALLEEKSSETGDGISGLMKAAGESHSEAKASISGIQDTVSSVKELVGDFRAESNDGLVGVKDVVDGLQTATTEAITATTSAISEFRAETRDCVAEVKAVVDCIKDDTKESFEEVNKTVEGAQVEVKEVVTSLDRKIDIVQADIKEAICDVKAAVGGSKTKTKESFTILTTTMEALQSEARDEIVVVKKLVEDSHSSNEAEHGKTHKQVTEVIGLVGSLQTEWKGYQPTLFDALLEMKKLLLEVQESNKAAAAKPDIELPPPYDDSQAQDKLDQLIAGKEIQAKHLPQLDLLSSIQQQVSATSASIAEFLEQRKSQALDEAAVKVEAARQAELDLEKSITEKRLIEAATERLRDEHDKLQVSVEVLQEETEDLRERKLTIAAELAGIETALTLRREELLMLEARGEALERRMLDGIIEQSRNLLKPKPAKLSKNERNAALRKVKNQPSPVKPKVNAAGTPVSLERRHFSQSQMGNDSPTGSKSGRTSLNGGGTLGLGQKEYSASLGLLGRSQSVKHTSYSAGRRKSSIGKPKLFEDERQPIMDEEAELEEYDILESEEEEGSVIRSKADDDEERNKYPALGLDFSGNGVAGSRNVSGVSSMA